MSDDEAPRPGAGPAPDTVTVVGIGADGWHGLGEDAREALRRAGTVIGGPRQLALLPPGCTARQVPWPSPLRPAVPRLLAEHAGRRVAVLASGDPMFHGIGRTLARAVGAERLRVLPHASSVSYACARLGWAVEDTEVVSLVGRPVAALAAALYARRRLLVLSAGAGTPANVAALLCDRGYGPSRMTVLEQLGDGARERRFEGTATDWPHPPGDPLNVVAVECRPAPGGRRLSAVPGLPDGAYEHDGQLTKRHVRAATLAALAPAPGELLWDIGGGSGSVAVEWMRAGRGCRAVSVERDPVRAARIRRNAERLGVPALRVVTGAAPEALEGLAEGCAEGPADGGLADGRGNGPEDRRGARPGPPDAVFVGGGLTTPGLLEACWAALPAGGRLVANTVTLESEALLAEWYRRHGGQLVRIAVSHAAPVGGFTGWRPAMPVTQWAVAKPGERSPGEPGPRVREPVERTPAE
ncbi:bifunctional cobalt-precorrin-7 (C(5))-methyltransferase/cobalt-precorrin-6B (C(15))-methyltransferase [Streptomyces albus]|uniref:bifunctional cobalt-precorrin-7 (C(5))-methyltransferase/cobalt-precorrin-6B (C(15))-methyltransferase n=1 Tax=Streptomyces albus TaxID=1888 RepID=UPI00068FC74B|nr:bifunctional cobalt-precorrin-7 (C(5))-methyltransferase/cobalt-precorrin-6B (C(15))-methyltransferase [Streptomyces albus]